MFSHAKLRMLEFDRYLRQHLSGARVEYVEMDTDSIYMSLAGTTRPIPSLAQLGSGADLLKLFVPPHRLDSFLAKAPQFFSSMTKSDRSFRTPGLFKIEWLGDGIIACSSKVYISWENIEDDDGVTTPHVNKIIHKGLSLRGNDHIGIADYFNAVMKDTVSGGTNRGLRVIQGRLRYYTCVRDSITQYYMKRICLDDMTSTVPILR